LEDAAKRFGLVVLDEAHHCPAASFTEVLQAFPARHRYGLTATPERADGLTPFLAATIGPAVYEVRREDLIAEGLLVEPEIYFIKTGTRVSSRDWAEIMSAVTRDERRNALILSLIGRAVEAGRSVLALSGRVQHAESLAAAFNAAHGGGAEVMHGKTPKKGQRAILERMRAKESRVLFASKLADEGLDLPVLDCLFSLTPTLSAALTTQRTGRTLRPAPGKRPPLILDLVDDNPILCGQAKARFWGSYRKLNPKAELPGWLKR
jgi:superfamily II DNA or RNA helicase